MRGIQITLVNETANHRFSEWCEPVDENVTRGEIFRNCRREYGRCISRMYHDYSNGPTREVGWVFEKRNNYDGERETYLQHAWIRVGDYHPAIPEHVS